MTAIDKYRCMCYYTYCMTSRYKGVSALIVTCAFAMFAIAAIPTHAKAYYSNGVDISVCLDTFCGDAYYGDGYGYGGNVYLGGVDVGYNSYYEPTTYSYPNYVYPQYQTYTTYYTYPVVQYSRPRQYRDTPDYFYRDWARAANEWDNQMRYWQ